jgi:TPR repeat protein
MDELIKAVKSGSHSRVNKILQKYSSKHGQLALANMINTVFRDERNCALYWAIRQDYIDTVKLLLHFGANVNQQFSNGQTAIEVAEHYHCHRVILLLKDNKQYHEDMAKLSLVKQFLSKLPADEKNAEAVYKTVSAKNNTRTIAWDAFFKALSLLRVNSALQQQVQQPDIVEAIEQLQLAAEQKLPEAMHWLHQLTKSETNSIKSILAFISLYEITKDEKYALAVSRNPLWQEYFNGICALKAWRQYSQPDFVAAANSFYKASKQGLLLAHVRLAECLEQYPGRFNVQERMRKAGELANGSARPDAVYVLNKAVAYLKHKTLPNIQMKSILKKKVEPLSPDERKQLEFLRVNIAMQKKSSDPLVLTTLAENLAIYAKLYERIDSQIALDCYKEAASLNHIGSMIILAHNYYYGLYDGSHIPAISETVLALRRVITTGLALRQVDVVEQHIEKLLNMKVLALELGRKSIDEFVAEAQAKMVGLYKEIVKVSLHEQRYSRADVYLKKLTNCGLLHDDDLAFISTAARNLKLTLFKLDFKRLEKKTVGELAAYLKSSSESEKLSAEKHLINKLRKGDSSIAARLISYYEAEAKGLEKKRDELLVKPTDDERKSAHECQLNVIHYLQMAAGLGAKNSEDSLRRYALLNNGVNSYINREGTQASVDLAKTALIRLGKLDMSYLSKGVADEKPLPSAPYLEHASSNPCPEGHTLQDSSAQIYSKLSVPSAAIELAVKAIKVASPEVVHREGGITVSGSDNESCASQNNNLLVKRVKLTN